MMLVFNLRSYFTTDPSETINLGRALAAMNKLVGSARSRELTAADVILFDTSLTVTFANYGSPSYHSKS